MSAIPVCHKCDFSSDFTVIIQEFCQAADKLRFVGSGLWRQHLGYEPSHFLAFLHLLHGSCTTACVFGSRHINTGREESGGSCRCLLQAFAMKLEKPNYRAVLFKFAMTEVWDISSGLGNVLLSAIPISFFQRNTYKLFDSRCLCCTCLGALHTPLGKLSSGCYGLLTSVHQGSVHGSRWLLAVRMFNFPLVARGHNFWFKDNSIISQLFFISPESSKHCRCVLVLATYCIE